MRFPFFLIIILISFGLYSQSKKATKTNLMKFGLNLYAEKGFESNLGFGLRYGYKTKNIRFGKTKDGRARVLKRKQTGFYGGVIKFNHSIETNWNQIELGFQNSSIITWGIYLSNTNFNSENAIGIKPTIGLSFFNFELYYAYYIPINEWQYVNRNNFVLGYRITKNKKQPINTTK